MRLLLVLAFMLSDCVFIFVNATNAPDARRVFTSKSSPKSHESNSGPPSQQPKGGERRSFNNNKDKFNFSDNDGKKDSEKWKSGYIFNQYNRKQQRNDPWWMRDEESTNPRIRPQYLPWWFRKTTTDKASSTSEFNSSTSKIADLRIEAEKRSISHDGIKKADLISLLEKSNQIYDLSDNNFRTPQFRPVDTSKPPPACYPENYEGSEENIAALRKRIVLVPPSSSPNPKK